MEIEYSCLECEIAHVKIAFNENPYSVINKYNFKSRDKYKDKYKIQSDAPEEYYSYIEYDKYLNYDLGKPYYNNFDDINNRDEFEIKYCEPCFKKIENNNYPKIYSLDKFLDLFLLNGKDPKNIRKIKITFPTNIQCIDISAEKYPNLEILDIRNITFLSDCDLSKHKKLTKFKISYRFYSNNFKTDITEIILPTQLENFMIYGNIECPAKINIKDLPNLQKLYLSNMLTDYTVPISLKKLKLEHICDKIKINYDNLINLENLMVINYDKQFLTYEQLSNLTNLKYFCTNLKTKDILSKLSEKINIIIVNDYCKPTKDSKLNRLKKENTILKEENAILRDMIEYHPDAELAKILKQDFEEKAKNSK